MCGIFWKITACASEEKMRNINVVEDSFTYKTNLIFSVSSNEQWSLQQESSSFQM
jgi:hypothetical protein